MERNSPNFKRNIVFISSDKKEQIVASSVFFFFYVFIKIHIAVLFYSAPLRIK